jgi:hypothetical protein
MRAATSETRPTRSASLARRGAFPVVVMQALDIVSQDDPRPGPHGAAWRGSSRVQ